MRVGYIQTAPRFGEPDANRAALEAAVCATSAELIVLPELCHSGYVFSSREEASQLAEPIPDGPTSQLLADAARRQRVHIIAGICERQGSELYNSAAVFGPTGHLATYRKVHLFKDEKLWFSPGDRPFEVVDLGTVKIGVLVCYDWRFPEAARALALGGAELIAHPANLVLPYCQEVMRARCIENRIFAVTANRVGTDHRPDGRRETFTGQSQVVDPEGAVLVRASADQPAADTVAIDIALARQKSINARNDLFTDRRPEFYQPLTD